MQHVCRGMEGGGGGCSAMGVKPQDACTPRDNKTGNHRKVCGDAGMRCIIICHKIVLIKC